MSPGIFHWSFLSYQARFLTEKYNLNASSVSAGIIQNFKVKYRKRLIKYVLARVNEKKSASEIVKSLNVLQAIQWVQESWKDVTNATIKNCFEKCGIVKRHEELMR